MTAPAAAVADPAVVVSVPVAAATADPSAAVVTAPAAGVVDLAADVLCIINTHSEPVNGKLIWNPTVI